MRVLVLGSSGGCGRWAVELAAKRGHTVVAQAREGADVPARAGVEIVRGEPLAPGLLGTLVPAAEAVLCCLGMKRRRPANPWSPLVTPPRFMEQVAGALVAAAAGRAQRVVAISAAGVAESAPALPWLMNFLIARSNVGVAYRDLAEMERVLRASPLAWEAVRPVTLVDGPPSGRTRRVTRFRMTSKIARGDVAQWLLDALERPVDERDRTPMVGWS